MKLSKTRISMAIGAILGASCLAPAISYGVAVDVLNDRIADSDAGDALLFPFYTTIGSDTSDPANPNGNPAVTSFSVTNTANATVAVKIRFREQKVSYDALDFIAILSPYDKFEFSIGQNPATGRPKVSWPDSTCVVGPTPGDNFAEFPDPASYNLPVADTKVTDADLAVGHLEVLGMAKLGNNACVTPAGAVGLDSDANGRCAAGDVSLAKAAVHSGSGENRVPANCQVLRDFFSSPDNVSDANIDVESADGTPFFEDAPNSLTGRYLVTVPGRGIEGGDKAIAIQNSNLTSSGGEAVAPYYVTAQSANDCVNNARTDFPSGNCKNVGYAWDAQEYAHPHLGDLSMFANLQNLMDATTNTTGGVTALGLSSDWSTNPANRVMVNWIVTAPNKYAYLDLKSENACIGTGSATNKIWCLLDNLPMSPQNRSFLRAANTDSNVSVILDDPTTTTTTTVDTVDITDSLATTDNPTATETVTTAIPTTTNNGVTTVATTTNSNTGVTTITTSVNAIVQTVVDNTTNTTLVDDGGTPNDTSDDTIPATVVTATINGQATSIAIVSGDPANPVIIPLVQMVEDAQGNLTPVLNASGHTIPLTTTAVLKPSEVQAANAQGLYVPNVIPATTTSVEEDYALPAGTDAATMPVIAIKRVDAKNELGVLVKKDPVTGKPILEDTGKCVGPNNTEVGCNAQHTVHIYAPVVESKEVIVGKENARKGNVNGSRAAEFSLKAGLGGTDLCSSSTMKIWGPEEQISTGYIVSPTGGSQVKLCNEVNVITFHKAGTTEEPTLIQTTDNRQLVTVNVDATRGWAFLPMGSASGDTVVGLNFTTRNTDTVDANNGTITELNKVLPTQ